MWAPGSYIYIDNREMLYRLCHRSSVKPFIRERQVIQNKEIGGQGRWSKVLGRRFDPVMAAALLTPILRVNFA